ncbi:MAG: hypothetical protein QOH25_4055 [Acidobacteriota bacterium]|jgi:hypothetical protein|nr:hypothetical protein [Acidobacteriota bacterium]
MKRQSLGVFLILNLIMIIAADSVNAQAPNFSLGIPFEFSVSDKVLPAGQYNIRRSPTGVENVLVIKSADGRASQQSRVQIIYSKENATESKKLIFTKYGDQRFLSEIWASSVFGRITRYVFSKGKHEMELGKKAKQDKNAEQPESVSLVIK